LYKLFSVKPLTEKGKPYIDKGLPERQLFDYLTKNAEIPISHIGDVLNLSDDEVKAAIGMLKMHGVLEIEKKNRVPEVYISNIDSSALKNYERALHSIYKNDLALVDKSILKDLIKRNLVEKQSKIITQLVLTPLGKQVRELINIEEIEDLIEILDHNILEKGLWRNKGFRKYDIKSPVPSVAGGRVHPLKYVMELVRDTFVAMGFREVEGPWVETAFWNMDSMFIPQDHPAREVQDTFYLDENGSLPPQEIVDNVRKVHETGWDTGSKGYQYKWDPKIAQQLLLRTHTTAVSYRTFYSGIDKPAKIFSIGRVFRNETPDKLHLPEFHQIEGFVIADGLNLRDLIGYLSEFYKLMGIERVKFKPTYNPYTEPSMEAYCYYSPLGKWVEMGNSGIFRPEAVRPYDINENIIAWGLALERLAAVLYNFKDIREILGHTCDLRFVQKYPYKEIRF
jgi:phenylalanyl-tRNA synthetase alpha chain